MTEFKHILVPTDFGESSNAALELAIDLSKKYGSDLTLLHTYELPFYAYPGMVYTPADLLTPIQESAQAQCDAAIKALRERVPKAKVSLTFGVPGPEIQKAIEELHADLVVMGTHGRSGVSHALLGSVAEKTVRLSKVPVLTVRAAPAA
ncbi:MAG TPA: universal stress protein [Polyangiaceae bacterium]